MKDTRTLLYQLLSTPNDWHNARYWAPLPNADDEEMAHFMADAIYSDVAQGFTDATTPDEADRAYQQCVADSRRMICDEEYAAIFEE